VRNLWDDVGAAAVRREMMDLLLEWRVASQYHTREWMRDYR